MYYGSRASWNLRDSHMFETLQHILEHQGETSKGVIWAHNSHAGDASATEMAWRGELNIGQLCRQQFGRQSYHIGFGTNDETVAAAAAWDSPMQIMAVRPAHPQSYERMFHLTNAYGFILPLRQKKQENVRERLSKPHASSELLASCTAPKANSRAIISRQTYRNSSTNTFGSTGQAPSLRSRRPNSKAFPTPTPSAFGVS
jgi:erythromycin esterase-like protein